MYVHRTAIEGNKGWLELQRDGAEFDTAIVESGGVYIWVAERITGETGETMVPVRDLLWTLYFVVRVKQYWADTEIHSQSIISIFPRIHPLCSIRNLSMYDAAVCDLL